MPGNSTRRWLTATCDMTLRLVDSYTLADRLRTGGARAQALRRAQRNDGFQPVWAAVSDFGRGGYKGGPQKLVGKVTGAPDGSTLDVLRRTSEPRDADGVSDKSASPPTHPPWPHTGPHTHLVSCASSPHRFLRCDLERPLG
jgi:hypothetical protein